MTGYNPTTWQAAATAAFPSPAAVGARKGDGTSIDVTGTVANSLCPTGGPPPIGSLHVAAALFNQDFTLLAVQITDPGGGHHVGVMDRSGTITDLTAVGGPGGADETNALFSADGKSIVFTANHVPAGAPTAYVRAVPGGARSEASAAGQLELSMLAANAVVVPNPAGGVAAMLDQTGAGTLQVWHLPTSGQIAGHGRLGLLHHVAGSSAEPWQLAACAPLAWENATTLVCTGLGAGLDLGAPASGDFWTIQIASDSAATADAAPGEETAAAVGQALLPSPSGTYYGAGVVVGSTLYAPQIVGGAAHVLAVPIGGGAATAVPAADPAFASPGFFLPAASGGANG